MEITIVNQGGDEDGYCSYSILVNGEKKSDNFLFFRPDGWAACLKQAAKSIQQAEDRLRGAEFRQKRKALKLTLAETAKMVDSDAQSICDLENGRRPWGKKAVRAERIINGLYNEDRT